MQTDSDMAPSSMQVHPLVNPPSARALPLRWLAAILNAFIDVVDPAVARFSRQKRWIALELEDGDLAFYRTAGARNIFFGNGSALDDKARRVLKAEKTSEIELRLLPERVTQAVIKVPAGGLDYVQQIVESRLDRLTPWKPEKVLYGFAGSAKAGPDGQFDIDVIATSRDIGASSISRLEVFGLTPSTMGSASEPLTQRLRVDLFRGRNDTARAARRKRIATVSIAIFAISICAYLASVYVVVQSAGQLGDLDEAMAGARRALVQGSSSMADRQKAMDYINHKTPDYARFALIDRLAKIIPDNTFLDELEIQQGSLRVAGTSTEASGLIKILESEPSVSDARFSAPVTRQDDGRDRFDITAVLKQQKTEGAQ